MTAVLDTFEAPGPGQWSIDRSHYPGGTTPISQWLMTEATPAGMRQVFGELGIPADTLDVAFVNGFMYSRLRPLIGADKPAKKLPPLPILKLATRLHPGFRKRNRISARVQQERPWLAIVDRWERELRPQLHAENQAFAAVVLGELDNDALADHLTALLKHCRRMFELHFWLHGYDLGPIAFYLVEAKESGIQPAEAVTALEGASPSTTVPQQKLRRLRDAVLASGSSRPTTLADVAAASPEAATMLQEYMAEGGQRLVTGYDLDAFTLAELPGVVLSSILEATDREPNDGSAIGAALRARVPADRRAAFDQCLSDARAVMDVRDDNGPNTVERPIGLLRQALLETGRRLAASGRVQEAEHLLEAGPEEVGPLLRTGDGPSATVFAERAAKRSRQADLEPPALLGQIEPTPPLDALPLALRRGVSGVQMALTQMGMDSVDLTTDPLMGIGVGRSSYEGRVRRAATPEEAISTMEPGDVLVVRATSPAFNAVLAIAGAVITADGGPLSHAAVLARELGIPAIAATLGLSPNSVKIRTR